MSATVSARVVCIGFVFDPAAQAIIRAAAPAGFELAFFERPDECLDLLLAACEFLLVVAPVTDAMMKRAPRLRMIQKWGVGVDKIDLAAARRHGICVAITAGVNAATIAEHTILLMLAVLRRLVVADRALREGRWIPAELRPQSRTLAGKTVGILGFGNIGTAVARLLQGFGTRILYNNVTGPKEELGRKLGATYAELHELLAQSDILTLHCPGGGRNKHLIDAAALAKLKPGAIVINAARGDILVEADLIEALASGHVSGAGLDTFDTEPLPAGSLLRHFDNVVLTPHAAGAVMDDVAPMAKHAFANMLRFLAGQPIPVADLVVAPARPRIAS